MLGLIRHVRATLLALTSLVVGSEVSACTPAPPVEAVCPAGGEKYLHYGSCPQTQFSIIALGGIRYTNAGRRCPGNRFPLYRTFTSDEKKSLGAIVETEAYKALANSSDFYGLSLWVEDRLVGEASSWRGPLLYNRAKKLAWSTDQSARSDAFKAALPQFAEHVEKHVLPISVTESQRARLFAHLAYFSHEAGELDAASRWLSQSEDALGPMPPKGSAGRAAWNGDELLVTATALCVEAQPELKPALCYPGGIDWFAHRVGQCLADAEDCEPIGDLPKAPDVLAQKIHEMMDASDRFATKFSMFVVGRESRFGGRQGVNKDWLKQYFPAIAENVRIRGERAAIRYKVQRAAACFLRNAVSSHCAKMKPEQVLDATLRGSAVFDEAYKEGLSQAVEGIASRNAECVLRKELGQECKHSPFVAGVEEALVDLGFPGTLYRDAYAQALKSQIHRQIRQQIECELRKIEAVRRNGCEISPTGQTYEGILRKLAPDYDLQVQRIRPAAIEGIIRRLASRAGSLFAADPSDKVSRANDEVLFREMFPEEVPKLERAIQREIAGLKWGLWIR